MSIYWQGDGITLYHGDCREETAWLEADVLVCDPPYGRAWKQGRLSPAHRADDSHGGIANDGTTAERDAMLEMWGTNGPIILFGDLMLEPPPGTKLVAGYRKPLDSGMRGAIGGVRRDLEAIYFLGKWGSGIGGRTSLFATRAPLVGSPVGLAGKTGHPHTKPLDVMQELIKLCPPGTIADPFAGSGSTLVAAKLQGRKAIGVELEEKYAEIAARRLDQGVLDFGDVG